MGIHGRYGYVCGTDDGVHARHEAGFEGRGREVHAAVEHAVEEAVEYAQSIIDSGREPCIDDFKDDYPCFVDGSNYQGYDYPYSVIFDQVQFEEWKKCHKKVFDGFDEFINYVKNRKKNE